MKRSHDIDLSVKNRGGGNLDCACGAVSQSFLTLSFSFLYNKFLPHLVIYSVENSSP